MCFVSGSVIGGGSGVLRTDQSIEIGWCESYAFRACNRKCIDRYAFKHAMPFLFPSRAGIY